jgi:phospholipid-binding lipoprotein MlaA
VRPMRVRPFRHKLVVPCVMAGLTLGGCATAPSPPQRDLYAVDDPLETVNRGIFDFNQAFDRTILKPVAIAYRDGVPDPVRNGIRNFLNNLRSPVLLLNDLLQGEFGLANATLGRFVINSTFGIGGVLDIAGQHGLPYHDADFGQTFGVWGIPPGPYLMLPILGPSDPRDATGLAAGALANPINYLPSGSFNYEIYLRTVPSAVDSRSRNIGQFDKLESTSLDYYATIRSLYTQRREAMIRHEKPPEAPVPGSVPGPASELAPGRHKDQHMTGR